MRVVSNNQSWNLKNSIQKLIFFLFFSKKHLLWVLNRSACLCRGTSNEHPQHVFRGASNEYPQHMFLLRNMKNYYVGTPLIWSDWSGNPAYMYLELCYILCKLGKRPLCQMRTMKNQISAFVQSDLSILCRYILQYLLILYVAMKVLI